MCNWQYPLSFLLQFAVLFGKEEVQEAMCELGHQVILPDCFPPTRVNWQSMVQVDYFDPILSDLLDSLL